MPNLDVESSGPIYPTTIVVVYLVKVVKDFPVRLLLLGTIGLLLSEKPIKRDAIYLFNNIANLSIFYREKVGALG